MSVYLIILHTVELMRSEDKKWLGLVLVVTGRAVQCA